MVNNADFHIKTGNTSPAIEAQLLDNNDDPVDLSVPDSPVSATVKFQLQLVGEDTLTVDNEATVEDAVNGIVAYHWKDTDTDVEGSYKAEFDVDYDGGTIGDDGTFNSDETFPNNDYLLVRIEENL